METTHLKQITVAPEKVSINTVITSVISELKSISSLNKEQRTVLKAFTDELPIIKF